MERFLSVVAGHPLLQVRSSIICLLPSLIRFGLIRRVVKFLALLCRILTGTSLTGHNHKEHASCRYTDSLLSYLL